MLFYVRNETDYLRSLKLNITSLKWEWTTSPKKDFSEYKNLKTLNISNLEKVIITNCLKLRDVFCFQSVISCEIGFCPKLHLTNFSFGVTYIRINFCSVKIIDCSETCKLTQLILHECKDVTMLNVSCNQLEELDVMDCEKLHTLITYNNPDIQLTLPGGIKKLHVDSLADAKLLGSYEEIGKVIDSGIHNHLIYKPAPANYPFHTKKDIQRRLKFEENAKGHSRGDKEFYISMEERDDF